MAPDGTCPNTWKMPSCQTKQRSPTQARKTQTQTRKANTTFKYLQNTTKKILKTQHSIKTSLQNIAKPLTHKHHKQDGTNIRIIL
jgi:carbonic anhydrase